MPILPENKGLYPPNWDEIRKRILLRDKYRCCGCGLRDHSVGYRDEDGRFCRDGGNIVHDLAGDGLSYPSLIPLSYQEAKKFVDFLNEYEEDGYRWIVIVLTIAHMGHNPENCSDTNLASLCQRCHNIYDRPHRNETRRLTRKRRDSQMMIEFVEYEKDCFVQMGQDSQ